VDICNKCKKPGDAASAAPNSAATPSGGSSSSSSSSTGAAPLPLPPSAHPPRVSPANELVLAELNALDMELYAFAERIFWLKAEACGVTPATVALDGEKAAQAIETAVKAKREAQEKERAKKEAKLAALQREEAAVAARELAKLERAEATPASPEGGLPSEQHKSAPRAKNDGAESPAFLEFQRREAERSA